MMESLRYLLLNQSDEVKHRFTREVLCKFWNEFHLFVWNSGRKFSSFQGNELALFIANVHTINEFLRTNLVLSRNVSSMIKGLDLWLDLFEFLGKSRIDPGTDYATEIDTYEKNAIAFYKAGKKTFLAKDGREGKNETCYMHVMRFYIPRHARITYERHNLGIGIFNMQGFERRNKESKNVYKRFTNKKQKGILISILGRLWEVFKFNKNSY